MEVMLAASPITETIRESRNRQDLMIKIEMERQWIQMGEMVPLVRSSLPETEVSGPHERDTMSRKFIQFRKRDHLVRH